MKKLQDLVDYGIYGTKRALFITPMMYATELISGLKGSQSLKSRLLSLGVNFFVAMPYNKKFRPWIFDKMGIDEKSSEYKKRWANRVAFAAHQLPLYLGILIGAGASLEQIAVALPTGLTVGMATAGKFQNFMDNVSEFMEKRLYQTKDKLSHMKKLSRSYAKNLAFATLIAATTKISLTKGTDYIKENNIITNPDKFVCVMSPNSDGFNYINKEDYNSKKHMLVFLEDTKDNPNR